MKNENQEIPVITSGEGGKQNQSTVVTEVFGLPMTDDEEVLLP